MGEKAVSLTATSMSHTPHFDAKVQAILDGTKPGERTCKLTGEKWMMDEEEISWYRYFHAPPSAIHPIARMKIICSFGTGFGWWWQKHPETGKQVLTYVHPATGVRAIPDAEFFEKDNTDKARDFDASRPFMDQIRELQLQIPFTASRSVTPTVNSISLLSQGDENSFFVTGCKSKNSFYSYSAVDMENSSEVYESSFITNSYNILNSHRIHNGKFIRQSYDCLNSAFLFDCRNCEFCFGATNQRNKKYVFFNEQLTKEAYEKRMSTIDLRSRKTLEEYLVKFRDLVGHKAVWPENFNEQAENSLGEYLHKCRDCRYQFFAHDGPNHNYYGLIFFGQTENNAFIGGAFNAVDNYYCHAPMHSRGCRYVHSCVRCQNVEYSMQCYDSENLFGCVGLIRKKFCIFNKQYTEEAYWLKLDEIKCHMLDRGEYGEFFPLSFTPSYVLSSPALMYLIDEEDVKTLGGSVYDPDSAGALGDTTTSVEVRSPEEVPDRIDELDADVWSKLAIMDPVEKRRFAYLKPEIELYRELGIASSTTHPMKRLKNLVFESNTGIFIDAECAKCGKKLTISKNKTYPDRVIYCREDYLKFLEGNG